MDSPKSSVEVQMYLTILEGMFADAKEYFPMLARSFDRDFETIKSRVRDEGLQVLTVLLPLIGKGVESALESGRLAPVPGVRSIRGSRCIPVIMSGLLRRLFSQDGHLVERPDPITVRILRQLCLCFYKLELPYTAEQERKVLDRFVETEAEIVAGTSRLDRASCLHEVARDVCSQILEGFDPKDVKPRHGPGSVATGERGPQKWTFSRLYDGIHQAYPYYDYFVTAGPRQMLDRVRWYKNLQRLPVGQAKVVLVPKDSRGPRLISCEPLEYQWIQQGLGRALVDHLELKSNISKGQINFRDQTVNQKLALESSKDKQFATLDLKDASDLVSLDLVERIFPSGLVRYLKATRTSATKLPDGRIQPLQKFAPMGSALCFPVESLAFYCLAVAGIMIECGISLQRARSAVFVYGDDIICRTEYANTVISALEDSNLRVNFSKSFIRSNFRESCGMDAFMGIDVTIARVRKRWPANKGSGVAVASYVELVNHLFEKGFHHAAHALRRHIDGRWAVTYGTVSSSGVSYRFDGCGLPVETVADAIRANSIAKVRSRWEPAQQRIQYWGYKIRQRLVPTELDGWCRLLRNLTLGEVLQPDSDTVRGAVKLQKGWIFPI